ncbi:MAG: alpha-isopropylmalate synthase regulatory domain-containing protein [Bradymonadaceae bacterium]
MDGDRSMQREKQDEMIGKMKEVLQDDYVRLTLRKYTLTEDLEEGTCEIQCTLGDADDSTIDVRGTGVGAIDAFFAGLRQRLADDYPSLKSIRFSSFEIQGLLSSDDGPRQTAKAEAEATVGIENSEGKEFVFQSTAPSVARAGLEATLEAAEYFVNSERTYVELHEILEHYRSEGRTDLVEKYTELMSEVVENTSYSEVVEEIRNSVDGGED